MRINKIIVRILFFMIVLLVVVLTLTGCWSIHEISDLAVINVMGIDQNEEGEVEITAVIIKSHNVFIQPGVSGGEESQSNDFLIETSTGESILQAVANLSSSVSERIYLGHMNVIVIGEEAARERMESSLDFFRRGIELRPNLRILVAKGSAARVIKVTPHFNITIGTELSNLTEHSEFSAGTVHDLSQFSQDFSGDTTDAMTGVIQPAGDQGIKVEPQKMEPNRALTENQQTTPKALSLKGTAVFKDAKLKGFIDEQETRGLLWIQGELKNEIVVLNCGESNNETVSLRVSNTQSQLSPRITDGSPRMTVDIQVEADVGEFTCKDHDLDTIEIDRLNKQLEKRVRQEAVHAINKVKDEWESDVFGFGKSINRKFPKEWKKLAPQWRYGQLSKMPINLKVSANISRQGLLKDPIQSQ